MSTDRYLSLLCVKLQQFIVYTVYMSNLNDFDKLNKTPGIIWLTMTREWRGHRSRLTIVILSIHYGFWWLYISLIIYLNWIELKFRCNISELYSIIIITVYCMTLINDLSNIGGSRGSFTEARNMVVEELHRLGTWRKSILKWICNIHRQTTYRHDKIFRRKTFIWSHESS